MKGNFWHKVAVEIIRKRVPILLLVLGITIFFATQIGVEIRQDYGKIVPKSDPEHLEYTAFKKEFGEDGNSVVVAVEGDLRDLSFFQNLYDLTQNLKKIEGVEGVLSVANASDWVKNDSAEKFELSPLTTQKPQRKSELDSIVTHIEGLPFYQNFLLTKNSKAHILIVYINREQLDSKRKLDIMTDIENAGAVFEKAQKTEAHYAGLPVQRVNFQRFLPKELGRFLGYALLITAITLLIFYRSIFAVIFPIVAVGISIIWTMGFQGLLGYQLTIVTGIIPALITVIGIPNSSYLLAKYHIEYRETRDKYSALTNVMEKIGLVTLMCNITTVIGLGTLAFTDVDLLNEFGIVSSVGVIFAFVISVLLIPIAFSFLPPPTEKQLKHLDRKSLVGPILWMSKMAIHHRKVIFGITGIIILISIWGTSKLEAISHMVDDVPKGSKLLRDLAYIEESFGGVMPFEIIVDTKKEKGIQKWKTIADMHELQKRIQKYPEISRTLSMADFACFARQAYYDGDPKQYDLPTKDEFNILKLYLKHTNLPKNGSETRALSDSSQSKTRITGNIKDIGSKRTQEIVRNLKKDIAETMDSTQYKVTVTGTTNIFLKGNTYLVSNLKQSLVLTLILIGLLMLLLYRNVKVMIISILPNILPLIMTAAMMGLLGIPLKPSTALIFSITFGISIDDTIHFLAAFRLHRKAGLTIEQAVKATFMNSGAGMIYSSLVLFAGFSVFIASSFGGTQALGILMSITLLIAMFSNLLFLPSLVMQFFKEKDGA